MNAKAECPVSVEALREDYKREALMTLRDALEKHILEIPHRYAAIVNELLTFSCRNPSDGYVLALSLAVSAASKTEEKE